MIESIVNPLDLEDEFSQLDWNEFSDLRGKELDGQGYNESIIYALKNENKHANKAHLLAFLELEKQRMKEAEKLIPNYAKLKVD